MNDTPELVDSELAEDDLSVSEGHPNELACLLQNHHVTHVQHGNAAATQWIKDCMDRALTGGIGAGTSIAIGLELL